MSHIFSAMSCIFSTSPCIFSTLSKTSYTCMNVKIPFHSKAIPLSNNWTNLRFPEEKRTIYCDIHRKGIALIRIKTKVMKAVALKLVLRSWWRNKAFSIISIVSLAIGIACTTCWQPSSYMNSTSRLIIRTKKRSSIWPRIRR